MIETRAFKKKEQEIIDFLADLLANKNIYKLYI